MFVCLHSFCLFVCIYVLCFLFVFVCMFVCLSICFYLPSSFCFFRYLTLDLPAAPIFKDSLDRNMIPTVSQPHLHACMHACMHACVLSPSELNACRMRVSCTLFMLAHQLSIAANATELLMC